MLQRVAVWAVMAAVVGVFGPTAVGTASAESAKPPPPTEPAALCEATGGDFEGCFHYANIEEFYNASVELIRAFAADTYADPTTVEPAGGWQLIPTYGTFEGACGPADHTSYAYCGPDDTVLVGVDQLWSFYILQGDAAAVIALAHEFGHALQMRAGIFELPEEQPTLVAIENQADCLAGAFTRWADENELLAEDDLEDIDLLLVVIASSEDDPNRDHGTLDERADSFIQGLREGVVACNAFFPDNPVTV